VGTRPLTHRQHLRRANGIHVRGHKDEQGQAAISSAVLDDVKVLLELLLAEQHGGPLYKTEHTGVADKQQPIAPLPRRA
jgi:hypothetical protein